jgi:hypothetical protein
MMDLSIRPVTPEIMRERGADAFDRGLGVDDHNMNPWVDAVADWKAGYRERQAQVGALHVLAAAMGMTPP